MNLVNAEVLARERGIEMAEPRPAKKGDFAALLHTEVETEQGKSVAAGTLFGDQYVRLVQLGAFRMEGYLDGMLLVFPHHDVPGLIGFVGTIFGKHGVNIAQMNRSAGRSRAARRWHAEPGPGPPASGADR